MGTNAHVVANCCYYCLFNYYGISVFSPFTNAIDGTNNFFYYIVSSTGLVNLIPTFKADLKYVNTLLIQIARYLPCLGKCSEVAKYNSIFNTWLNG